MVFLYKISLKRTFIFCILLLTLAYVHFLILLPSSKHRIDLSPAQNETTLPNNSKLCCDTESVTVSPVTENTKAKMWYFENGTIRPTRTKVNVNGRRLAKLWPHEAAVDEDRITNQLMYIPANYTENSPMKTIVIYPNLNNWAKPGQTSFIESNCPVNRCNITDKMTFAPFADAIIFRSAFAYPKYSRPPNQVWILHLLESPHHTDSFRNNDAINWTATYRRDSDIVTPYGYWVYYDEKVKQLEKPLRNYAASKTRQVAWFVSNCGARNQRLKYAKTLQKFINVDIYGHCGPFQCPRVERCFNLLNTKYKFYLAFENSNCIDYITEKLYFNGLQHDILPIVMGARPEDYKLATPEHSYIHIDDFNSPQDLALYLHKLDQNDDLYNSYFLWKGTGEFINTLSLCRICAMLHDNYPIKWYSNINRWWGVPKSCVSGSSWNKPE